MILTRWTTDKQSNRMRRLNTQLLRIAFRYNNYSLILLIESNPSYKYLHIKSCDKTKRLTSFQIKTSRSLAASSFILFRKCSNDKTATTAINAMTWSYWNFNLYQRWYNYYIFINPTQSHVRNAFVTVSLFQSWIYVLSIIFTIFSESIRWFL